MGGGNSHSGGGGGSSTQVADTNGGTIDLTGIPLKYGKNDKQVTGALRAAAEDQENKRRYAKIEFGRAFDENGNPVEAERKGGTGSVKGTARSFNAYLNVHNHPREEGELGGTFSVGDVDVFVRYRARVQRVSAKEGTYSMTKQSDFNPNGLYTYYKAEDQRLRATYSEAHRRYDASYLAGSITRREYQAAAAKAFNEYLVGQHNALLAGQKKYGYSYTLERSGK